MGVNGESAFLWADSDERQSGGYITSVVIEQLKAARVSRVLDLGSGNGALCARLKAAGFDVVGAEFDAAGVDIARQAHPDIRFYCFGVQDDPALMLASEAPFEAVVSTEVVEHLFSPHLLVSYAKAVLKAGGHLVVSTPYHGYLKNVLLAVFGKWDHHHTSLSHGGHIKFFSRKTLCKLLTDGGFKIERFAGAGRLPYLWKSMVVTAVNKSP